MTVYNSILLTNVIKEYLAPTLTNTRWIWPNNFWIVNLWICVNCNKYTFQDGGHWHEGICFPNNIQDMHISCFWSKCFEKHELQKICGLLSGKWTLFDNPKSLRPEINVNFCFLGRFGVQLIASWLGWFSSWESR